jgi:decaprenyl-phosphate phosphoribosyltransferase
MIQMRDVVKLLRVKHYIKNLLIFIPLFFAGKIFDRNLLEKAFIGFVCFCLISSAVYILNDIQDREKDRLHPKKKMRPIASGSISVKQGIGLFISCFVGSTLLSLLCLNGISLFIILLYLVINIAYSIKLKNKPIIDIVILASGFVMRIIYGGAVVDIPISKWLYLVVVSGALFMGLGKRRNELTQQKNTREVLKYYTETFLDKNMYVCFSLIIVFYAMWTLEFTDSKMIWTVPTLIIILMKYSMDIEGDSDGDPVNVLLQDKILIVITILYAICIFAMMYF